MKKTIISLMLLVGLIISPTSAFAAQIYSADAILTPAAGNLMGGLGCFVGGEVPGQYDWTIGNCVPGGTPTDDMVFSTQDTTGWQERMRITKEGNVGIGTTNPGANLHVADRGTGDDLQAKLKVGLGDPAQNATVDIIANDNAGSGRTFQVWDDNDLTTPRFLVTRAGNVGIGTTEPNYKLDVEGDVQAHAYHTGDIFFQKNGEELWRMFEDEEGLYLENLKTGKVYRFLLQAVKK